MEKSFSKQIPKEIVDVSDALQEAGFEAYLVGGCVRDVLRGAKPKDWDLTTNATPEQIMAIFPHTYYENEFGTVGVVNDNATDETLKNVEVTTYRLEAEYHDNRRPSNVQFSQNLEDDLKRRDFTINAIAISLPQGGDDSSKGQIVDLFGGQEDLSRKIIRTVGDPQERFGEDALRILRAIRLSAELGFTISLETAQAIQEKAETLSKISKERIRDEFVKILMSKEPMLALIVSHKMGVLQYVLPDLERGIGIDQNQAHSFDVWEHNLRALQHGADNNWPLLIRLSALLHDISKPETRRWSEEKKDWTFYGHDVVGGRVARKIMNDLKFSAEMTESVATMVRWHMFFSDPEQITLSAVRRMVKNVGPDRIWDLMNLRICDRIGTGRPKAEPYRFRKYQAMIEEAVRSPVTVGMLKVDGVRLMEILEEKPGPKIGHVLNALLEEVLEAPEKNTEEYLENRAKEMAALPESELIVLAEAGKAKKEEEDEREVKEIRGRYRVD
jgi:poly(A) polymerase/tRNA nucleotidyltransferase (CCA-adding enzyme)